jgi:hydroxymethylpyrimidine pyrophosphatase-like HAD family hydrolase
VPDDVSRANIRLLATDLDGTLIGRANELPLHADFAEILSDLRKRYGTIWVACTGRSLKSFRRYFEPMQLTGLAPDYIIVRHAYILRLTPYGYIPYVFWNIHIAYMILSEWLNVRTAIRDWHMLLTRSTVGVKVLRHRWDELALRFDTQESAHVAEEMLRSRAKAYRHVRVFGYHMEVHVRSVPFTKGLSLGELAGQLGIPRENILAIGNGHNDSSMLDGTVAAMTGCVSNSEAELVELVSDAGGHVARAPSLSGVLEILRAYDGGTVNSEKPKGWMEPSRRENPHTRSHRRPHRQRTLSMQRVWLIVAVVYCVLLVFASFDMLPFSSLVLLPVRTLLRSIMKLFGMIT